jgi:diketogulonate reductase-like aldo/keto reductase
VRVPTDRKKTIAFFESKGVKMQSYRTLRDGKAFTDPTIVGIAAKHSKSAAQARTAAPRCHAARAAT